MADEKEREKKFAKDFLEKWARAEREEGPAEEALAREEEAVLKDPRDAAAWLRRGLVLADLERWADALASFERAEALQPDLPRIHLAKSYVLSRLERPEDAVEEYRQALQDLATGIDEELARKLAREEEVEEALAALAEDLRAEEPAIVEGLKELESLAKEVEAPPENDFEAKIRRWGAEGYDVAPLQEVLERDPDRARTAFFQFEQNVRKIEVLRDTVNALDPEGIEDDIAQVRQLFRAPYQIWRVEAEMATLLEKAEARDRARRARVTPSPEPVVAARPRLPSAVNGLRARVPPGQVNGLINGVRGARAGLTNGLTNGLGFTNGLASRRFLAQARGGWARILLMPLVAILLLSVALFLPPAPEPPAGGVAIDGSFGEWRGVPGYVQASTAANGDVDLRAYKVLLREGHLSLYASVSGAAFRTRTGLDLFFAFLDADGDGSTGYDEGRVGADVLLEVRGGNGTVLSTHAWAWGGSDRDDWNGWRSLSAPLMAAAAGSEIEAKVDAGSFPTFDPQNGTVSLRLTDQEGSRSTSALVARAAYGALEVVQAPASDRVTGDANLLVLTFRAVGRGANVTGLTIDRGPATPRLEGFAPFSLAADEVRTVPLRVNATGMPPQTFLGASLADVASDLPVTITGLPARAYVDRLPTAKVVDGLFAEWTDTRSDLGNVSNPNVNILETAAEEQAGVTFLFAKVGGEALGGDPMPIARFRPQPGPPGTPSAPPLPTPRVGEDRILAYFDAPAVAGGVPVGGITADTLLEVRGRDGIVRAIASYAWEGRWVARGNAQAAVAGSGIEASIALPGLDLRGAPYVVETRDWRGTGERTQVEGVRGVRFGPEGASFVGSYTATLPPTAAGEIRFLRQGLGLAWPLPKLSIVRGDDVRLLAVAGPAPLEVASFLATYPDPYGVGGDVSLTALSGTLKETIVFRRPVDLPSDAALHLDQPIRREGALMVRASGDAREDGLLVEGSMEFIDGQGLSFVLPPPWAEDAAGRRIDLRYHWADDRLRIAIPGSWLAAATYPVTVDPTLTYTLRNDGPSYKVGEQMGYSVAVGDFNGDGYADVLAGAPFNSLVGTNVGYAYIYYGPFTADRTAPDVRFNGTSPTQGRFGIAVAAGRFNGDAFWDALVSRVSLQGTAVGDVVIFHGSSGLSGEVSTPDVRFTPPSNPQNFGITVGVGNLDNAQYDDVLISEPGKDNDGGLPSQDGVVYVYKSPFPSVVSSANYTLFPSTNAAGQFGRAIATGTIDSDAYADVVVGEPFASSNNGRVHSFKGSTFTTGSGDRYPDATLSGSSAERFGSALAVGALNGDAYADLVVGAPTKSPSNAGGAYIFLANANGTGLTSGASPSVTLGSQSSSEQFGTSVLVSDLDNDGSAGVVVGAPLAAAGGTNRGRAYWFDDPLSDQTVDETFSGAQNNERLGNALAGGRSSSDVRTTIAISGHLWDKNAANNNDNDGRVVVAQIPELLPALLAVAALVVACGRSVERRRLVRKR